LSSQTVGAESAAALLTHARLVAAALPQADKRSSPMLHFDFRIPIRVSVETKSSLLAATGENMADAVARIVSGGAKETETAFGATADPSDPRRMNAMPS